MSDEQRLELLREHLGGLGPGEVGAAFRRGWGPETLNGEGALLVAVRPDPSPGGLSSLARLRDAVVEEKLEAPEPLPVASARIAEAVGIVGGSSAWKEEVELDVRSVTLGNGIRIHVREMKERSSTFYLELTLAGGRILETEGTYGSTSAAVLPLARLAVVGEPRGALRLALGRAGLRWVTSVDGDCVRIRLSGDAGRLEEGLETLRRVLSDPVLDEPALEWWRSQLRQQLQLSPEGRTLLEATRLLTGDDLRFRLLTSEQIEAVDLEGARSWLGQLLRAPLECALAGDVDAGNALRRLAAHLSGLPEREETVPARASLRRLPPFEGPRVSRLRSSEAVDRSSVLFGWRAAPWGETTRRRATQVVTRLLDRRLRRELREERGLCYDVACAYSPSRAYPAAAMLTAGFYAEPGRRDEAEEAALREVEDLRSIPPAPEEVAHLAAELSELADRVEGDPKYWARVLSEADLRGVAPAQLVGQGARFRQLDQQGVYAILCDDLRPERRVLVTCDPG